jgi:hypothetical protein
VTPGELPPWGPHTLSLALPGLAVTVRGLSGAQHRRLRDDYRAFTRAPAHSSVPEVTLQAGRLDNFNPPAAAALTRDGQYTPLKSARNPAGGFDLTGINFNARLYPAGNRPGAIAVAGESHLAHANVFENALRVLVAYSALRQGGAVLHSAGIVADGRAWIFCGRSNAGKTTLTRKAHAAGLGVLSDDINLLLPSPGGFHAHAVPFTGEFGRTLDTTATGAYPVAALVLLRQGAPLSAQAVSPASAAAALLAGCPFVNNDEDETDTLLDTVTGLASALPVLQLTSALDDDIGAIMQCVRRELGLRDSPLPIQAQAQANTQANTKVTTQAL